MARHDPTELTRANKGYRMLEKFGWTKGLRFCCLCFASLVVCVCHRCACFFFVIHTRHKRKG